jgi:hypothetical protein
MVRRALVNGLLGAVLLASTVSACAAPEGDTAVSTATPVATGEAEALADLQASPEWLKPRCRWLKTGAWILAFPQETAVYRAAYEAGFIEMTQVGEDNRIGTVEPAWKIALTESGKIESASCSTAAGQSGFGVPVSRRRFVAAAAPQKDLSGYSIFEVELTWVPTAVGESVRHVLMEHMSVEEGPSTARVTMARGPGILGTGANGWAVMRVDDEPWRPRFFKPRSGS